MADRRLFLRRRSRLPFAIGSLGGLGLIAVLATSAPLAIFELPPSSARAAEPQSRPSNQDHRQDWDYWTGVPDTTWEITRAAAVIFWVVLAAALIITALVVIRAQLRKRHRRDRVSSDGATAKDREWDPALAVDQLTRVVDEALVTLRSGRYSEGIISCWRAVEETATAAGLPRETWETDQEYVARLLEGLNVGPDAIGMLCDLYREARFSSHQLDEDAQQAARVALRDIRLDLQFVGQSIWRRMGEPRG